jgi:polar amino acid transport system substrate-binding protein
MRSRLFAALSLCGVLALGIIAAGCGSSNDDDSSTTSGGDLTATPGINVAVDQTIAAQAAMEFFGKGDNKTVIGADADIAKALGQIMGLQSSMQNVTFDSIIPGLAAGKYDLGMSSFTDTKEREATVDFVTYAQAGTSFYTKAEGGTDVSTLEGQAKKCGGDTLDVQVFPDQNGANLAISSGKAELGMADSPVAAYIVKKSGGQFKLTGKAYGTAPYGIAIPKGTPLTKQVLGAMKKLIANGKYKAILAKWGTQQGAITKPVTNGATS